MNIDNTADSNNGCLDQRPKGLIMTDKLLDSPFYLLSVNAWESMEEFLNSSAVT